ncbi:unnamed protein product [Durusdinium trenchii]|uniref:Uncharacterized protein n=1 Tax=Durusdinium trenchii TaxID=1381693 RepID=A0ABP0NYT7_9DINO
MVPVLGTTTAAVCTVAVAAGAGWTPALLVTLLLCLALFHRLQTLHARCATARAARRAAERRWAEALAQQGRLAARLKQALAHLAKQEAAIALEGPALRPKVDAQALQLALKALENAEVAEKKRLCEVLLVAIDWALEPPWANSDSPVAAVSTYGPRADYHAAFAEALAPGSDVLAQRRAMRRSFTAPVIESEEVLQQCAGAQLENVVSSALEGLQSAMAWWRSG